MSFNISTSTFTQVTPVNGAGRRSFVNHSHIIYAAPNKEGFTQIWLTNNTVMVVLEPIWAVLGLPPNEVQGDAPAPLVPAKPDDVDPPEEDGVQKAEVKTLSSAEVAAAKKAAAAELKKPAPRKR